MTPKNDIRKAILEKQKTGKTEEVTKAPAEKHSGSRTYEKPVRNVSKVAGTPSERPKPMDIVDPKLNRLIAWGLFLFALVVYMLTQARTMSFWDSGEYATCISILGVPHPPGNPFYIVFGRALVALFGSFFSHAIIAAFISVLTSAFAVMFTYYITVQLSSMFKIKAWEAIYAGVIAALLTAFSFTFWMNAIEAEVYSGLVFFVNIVIWLTLVWVKKTEDYSHQNLILFIVYLFFLGFCVHQSALQVAPAVLFIVLYPTLRDGIRKPNFWTKAIGYTALLFIGYWIFGKIGESNNIDAMDKWGFMAIGLLLLFIELRDVFAPHTWLIGVVLVLIGLSSHMYLMIRSAQRPFINEGEPSTMRPFWDYVLRRQYGQTSIMERRGSFFGDQVGHHFLRYFGWQWFETESLSRWLKIPSSIIQTLTALFITGFGALGAWFQYKKNKHSFFYFLPIILFTTIIWVFIINLSSGEVRDRDYFFVTAYNMWAIWLGMGALAIIHHIKAKKVQIAVAALICILPLVNLASQFRVHDRSEEYIALDYGLNFLNSLEENAIIFTNGDNDTFPLWYAQAVEDPNAKGLENSYPAKDVYPDPPTEATVKSAMEYKTKYLKGIRKDISVANLSLLNTDWYLKQLRDKEGINLNFSKEVWDSIENPVFEEFTIQDKDGKPRKIKQRKPFIQPSDVMQVRGDNYRLTIPAPANRPEMGFSIELPVTPNWEESNPFKRSNPQSRDYITADLTALQLIKDNFGKRPIYFAVTCENYLGFEKHVRKEGMVVRLVHTQEENQMDIDRMVNNIEKVYQYRSIDNHRVHKDANMQKLIANYAAGFRDAANYYLKIKNTNRAKQMMERALPFLDERVKLLDVIVGYQIQSGDFKALDAEIENTIFPHKDGWRYYFGLVLDTIFDSYPQHIPAYLEKGMVKYGSNKDLADYSVELSERYNRPQETKAVLEKIKNQLPYDIAEHTNQLQIHILAMNGQWSDLDKYISESILSKQNSSAQYVKNVLGFMIRKYPANALPYFEKGLLNYPDNKDMADYMIGYAERQNAAGAALNIMLKAQPVLKYDITEHIYELRSMMGMDLKV